MFSRIINTGGSFFYDNSQEKVNTCLDVYFPLSVFVIHSRIPLSRVILSALHSWRDTLPVLGNAMTCNIVAGGARNFSPLLCWGGGEWLDKISNAKQGQFLVI